MADRADEQQCGRREPPTAIAATKNAGQHRRAAEDTASARACCAVLPRAIVEVGAARDADRHEA